MTPTGMVSILDTDLVKLTMHCAILKYFPVVEAVYSLKNRTSEKKFSRQAFESLQTQIEKLQYLQISDQEIEYLEKACPHLGRPYIEFLRRFRFDPERHVIATFEVEPNAIGQSQMGNISLIVKGLWIETTLYEVPLLALTSEVYFRFVDSDWTYSEQESKAYSKGMRLLRAGCCFGEYGTRRRRDFHTQDIVMKGLAKAKRDGEQMGLPGSVNGTSNVYLAMQHNLKPMGTVGHEWFMGIAALSGDYRASTAIALAYWLHSFGRDFWLVAPTDTLGTQVYLDTFQQFIPPIHALPAYGDFEKYSNAIMTNSPFGSGERFADVFNGVRQDSGNPISFIEKLKHFYDQAGIATRKTLVFSDSLNVDLCLEYQALAEKAGFDSTFGVGTSFTNDFVNTTTGAKSTPLNVVMKPISFNGVYVVKLGDTAGKNSGDDALVQRVKTELGYTEMPWSGSDESNRWE
ncbi:nicotinate phosphoribosyltransferase [Cadophora sp. DSE1049]|nr:nicotinate phosphoribosyltransferase [Cadophora sp. DSE1049]